MQIRRRAAAVCTELEVFGFISTTSILRSYNCLASLGLKIQTQLIIIILKLLLCTIIIVHC